MGASPESNVAFLVETYIDSSLVGAEYDLAFFMARHLENIDLYHYRNHQDHFGTVTNSYLR